MKVQITNYSTRNGGDKIGVDRFKRAIEKINGIEIILDSSDQKHARQTDTQIILIACGAGLHYQYSPGLGTFPNERESIELYGDGKNILSLCRKLDEIGIPITTTIKKEYISYNLKP